MEWLKNNWAVLLPILVSIVTAFWTARTSFRQKRMEDNLARSKAAYDIMLRKEFEFYEKIDVIYADLIPRVHDIIDGLTGNSPLGDKFTLKKRQKQSVENYLKFLDSIPKLKNLGLSYEIYIPREISKADHTVVITFQNSIPFLSNEIKKLMNSKTSNIDKDGVEKLKDELLLLDHLSY